MGSQDEEATEPLYRSARPVPFELIQHCGIFLEEKLYTQALELLTNILVSGTVATSSSTPAFVPSPQYLGVAATFLVHPSTTTRAKTSEEKDAASAALRLLRLVNTLVGPLAAKFDVAFSFTHFESSRHGTTRRRGPAAGDEVAVTETLSTSTSATSSSALLSRETGEEETRVLTFELAQSGSLWSRAEDFWQAVGWAFNCSVRHPERWQRWQLWLHFMCEVLEDDWNERLRLSRLTSGTREEGTRTNMSSKSKKKVADDDHLILKGSLIFRYLIAGSGGYSRIRRVLRAIFADGGTTAVNEFREVFKNELKQNAKPESENLKKREVEVNVDEDEYADYMSQDDDEEAGAVEEAAHRRGLGTRSSNPVKRPRRGTKPTTDPPVTDISDEQGTAAVSALHSHSSCLPIFGGYESLSLRQRLLQLLSTVSQQFPTKFIPLEELYHLFVENLRHLPFPIFQAFVSPHVLPHFTPAAQTTLCEYLLFRMRESGAPDTDDEYLNQTKLEECFLPYAANTPSLVDNAKVSITLEALLVLLAESNMLKTTPKLKAAVEEGIAARAEKVQIESRKYQSSKLMEDTEWAWLLESGDRLIFLVDEVISHPLR